MGNPYSDRVIAVFLDPKLRSSEFGAKSVRGVGISYEGGIFRMVRFFVETDLDEDGVGLFDTELLTNIRFTEEEVANVDGVAKDDDDEATRGW